MVTGRRALVVGIDDYPNAPLQGCVADATAIAQRLASHADGSPNYSVKLITKAVDLRRTDLRNGLEDLFGNAQGYDTVFYFSGHGRQSSFGAELVAADLDGVSMDDLISLANRSTASSVTLIIDCCFSGNLGNATVVQAAQVAEEFRRGISVLREGVTVLAASRPTEASWENDGHGVFTRLLLDGLDGGATDHLGTITPLSLYGFASPALGAWDQRPIFKAHVTEPPMIRVGPPWLDPALLRQLPIHFESQGTRVTMTPDHEGIGRPLPSGEATAQQKQFDYFKSLRNANLVATDDGEDLYFAALNGHDVFLTPLGQYFWDRANRGLL